MAANLRSGFADEAEDPISDINVTPLVDVTLVLLIVFMITVPAVVGSARVKVNLPETTAVAADSEQLPLVFQLSRDESGSTTLLLNGNPIDEAGVRTLFKGWNPEEDQPVSLSADRGIPYGQVMKVFDLLESCGVRKLALDTRHVDAR